MLYELFRFFVKEFLRIWFENVSLSENVIFV